MGQAHARVRHIGFSVTEPAIRDAATLVLVRQLAAGPAVLMGQRGAQAAFMPNKFVFPGGAVDAGDQDVPLATPVDPVCAGRLDQNGPPGLSHALAAAAIRELWEEAGLILGRPGTWSGTIGPDWQDYSATGHMPDAAPLRFVFRAITPPGRPRRFDARFFVADATAIQGELDDFSRASDELSHLQWVPIAEARALNLPFITEVVLAEVTALLGSGVKQPESVPFFDNSGPSSMFRRLA